MLPHLSQRLRRKVRYAGGLEMSAWCHDDKHEHARVGGLTSLSFRLSFVVLMQIVVACAAESGTALVAPDEKPTPFQLWDPDSACGFPKSVSTSQEFLPLIKTAMQWEQPEPQLGVSQDYCLKLITAELAYYLAAVKQLDDSAGEQRYNEILRQAGVEIE